MKWPMEVEAWNLLGNSGDLRREFDEGAWTNPIL